MSALAIVGDVHGDIGALRAMLARLEPLDREIVFLGDYVNGGSESAPVLETLSHHASRHPALACLLAGNHVVALFDYVRDGNLVPFATLGGVATLASDLSDVNGGVHAALVMALVDQHRRLLEGLA